MMTCLSLGESGTQLNYLYGEPDEPKLYVVATLALIEEQPYAEIADALNMPLGTVKSRLNTAIRVLREELIAGGTSHEL